MINLEKYLDNKEIIKMINNNEVSEEELADYLILRQKENAEREYIHCYIFEPYDIFTDLKNKEFANKMFEIIKNKLKEKGYKVFREVDGMYEYTRF